MTGPPQIPGPWAIHLDVPNYQLIIDVVSGVLGTEPEYMEEVDASYAWCWRWPGNRGMRLRHVSPLASDRACEWFFESWNTTTDFMTLGLASDPPSLDQVVHALLWLGLLPAGTEIVYGDVLDHYGIQLHNGILTWSR